MQGCITAVFTSNSHESCTTKSGQRVNPITRGLCHVPIGVSNPCLSPLFPRWQICQTLTQNGFQIIFFKRLHYKIMWIASTFSDTNVYKSHRRIVVGRIKPNKAEGITPVMHWPNSPMRSWTSCNISPVESTYWGRVGDRWVSELLWAFGGFGCKVVRWQAMTLPSGWCPQSFGN